MFVALKCTAFVLTAAIAMGGCVTPAQRKAAEQAALKKEIAHEVEGICALPEAERAAGLRKLKDEFGMELYCTN